MARPRSVSLGIALITVWAPHGPGAETQNAPQGASFGAPLPTYPVDWKKDVRDWWAGHPFNPSSPRPFRGPVASPAPRIDVSYVREKNPRTTTAGIAEALRLLPPSGGTLWFPKDKGPYVVTEPEHVVKNLYPEYGAIPILRRSNIHFLSDGAVIRSAGTIFNVTSMEYADRRRVDTPVRNFHFKNLVFDGDGRAQEAVRFDHARDILFEGCIFRNYAGHRPGGPRHHPGIISAATKTDNLWCLDCRFESGMHGVYWDGTHGSGLVACPFGSGLTHAAALLLTNDDMSPYSPEAQRSSQYVVLAHNRMSGREGASFVSMSAANVLIAENVVEGPLATLVYNDGKPSGVMPEKLRYQYYGNRIVRNVLSNVRTLLHVRGWYESPTRTYDIGRHLVLQNVATGLENLLVLDPNHEGARIEGIEVRANRFSGPCRVRILRPGVRDIRISGNVLSGAAADRVVAYPGFDPSAVTFTDR